MNAREAEIREAFRTQAKFCRAMASDITADALDAAADNISRDTQTGRRILDWQGDASARADNVTLRLAGGFHAIARSGEDKALTAAYRGEGDLAAAIESALVTHDAELFGWLDYAPQTNEVARAAIVMAGLLVASDRFGLPFELLELGASAGLVTNLDLYRYDLNGVKTGDLDSPLLIEPGWKGDPPPQAPINIASCRGVDLNPIDLSDPAAAERLVTYIWPDQPERIARAETAIAIARNSPPAIDRGDAASWTEARLADRQANGMMRVVYHTIAFQYFPEDQKHRVRAAILQAGNEATNDRPFGWLAFEFNEADAACEMRLTLWPGGEDIRLANAHPHLKWVKWLA